MVTLCRGVKEANRVKVTRFFEREGRGYGKSLPDFRKKNSTNWVKQGSGSTHFGFSRLDDSLTANSPVSIQKK